MMNKAKAAGAVAAIIVAAFAAYKAPEWRAQYRARHNGFAAFSDAEMDAVLQGPAPKDYVVLVRRATSSPPNHPMASKGGSSEGLITSKYGTTVSNAYAAIRRIAAWRVEQLPFNGPGFDVVVRTPEQAGWNSESVQRLPQKAFTARSEHEFEVMSEKAADRFLQTTGWRLMTRKSSIPYIRLYDPASAPAGAVAATSPPDFSDKTPRVAPPRATHSGSYVYTAIWSPPPKLRSLMEGGPGWEQSSIRTQGR